MTDNQQTVLLTLARRRTEFLLRYLVCLTLAAMGGCQSETTGTPDIESATPAGDALRWVSRARKAIQNPDKARANCRDILSRRSKKTKVKIKNDLYLAEAILHAMRKRAEKQPLKKPLKLSEVPDEV